MKKRPFGRTGLESPEIVLGGGIIGGILILAQENTRREAMERAAAAGIDWIDTAESYGNGVSETTIGRYLPGISPRPGISTKVRLAPEDLSDIPGAVERRLEASLKRLGLDRVEVYQLHNQLGGSDAARGFDPAVVLKKDGVADAMDRLKGQGLFQVMGMTALGETASVIEVIDSGRFESAQVYYNLLNPSAAWDKVPPGWSAQDFSGIMAACKRHGMAIMNIRALAGGSLASPQPHGREAIIAAGSDLDRERARAAAARAALGDGYGTPAQTALRFVLANPDLSCTVFGLAELSHLEEALEAVAKGPLPPEALQLMQPVWNSDFRA